MDMLLALLGALVAVAVHAVRRTRPHAAIEWLPTASAGSLGP